MIVGTTVKMLENTVTRQSVQSKPPAHVQALLHCAAQTEVSLAGLIAACSRGELAVGNPCSVVSVQTDANVCLSSASPVADRHQERKRGKGDRLRGGKRRYHFH